MSKGTKTKKQQTQAKRVIVEVSTKQAASDDLVDDKEESEPTEGFLTASTGEE